MTIRIRPADIEVPPDAPFQNDLLDRKPPIETLTGLLGALEGPCVLALDSEWGGGKTTFLKLWAAHLRNEGFAVAEFNAWETDFSGDPFIALSSRLRDQFDRTQPNVRASSSQRFSEAAKRIALRAAPIAMRIFSQGLLDSGSIEQAFAEELSSYAEKQLDKFDEVERSFIDFKESLQEEVISLSEKHQSRPLFVMIDELDRCRPSYAVELLEAAKHLFSVDKVIFVLAINRAQLVHSIKRLYGTSFDAEGYFRRFFDVDYALPLPKRADFVLQTLRDLKFDEKSDKNTGIFEVVPTMIAQFLARSNLDFRRIGQAVRRISLACASLDGSSYRAVAATSVAVIVREIDPQIYRAFCVGDVDDKGLLDSLWGKGDLKSIQCTSEGNLLAQFVNRRHGFAIAASRHALGDG